ncbi:hypothetical protein [Pararhizobium sp. PWRC1-1]|uniref:hypothetical protein n=1 Tax=Pararhizobium sp. PWRC1-1 TaxID=2804566 RepID=UPI003CF63914
MKQRPYELIIVLLLAVIYWQVFSIIFDVHEPWDVPIYWVAAYPASIVLSAIASSLLRTVGWTAGPVITFAQLPILLESNDLEPTILFAIGILAALSLLPAAAAALAARFTKKP